MFADHGGPFPQWVDTLQKRFPALMHGVSRTQQLPGWHRNARRWGDRVDSSGNQRHPQYHNVKPKTFGSHQSNLPPQWARAHHRNIGAGPPDGPADALSKQGMSADLW